MSSTFARSFTNPKIIIHIRRNKIHAYKRDAIVIVKNHVMEVVLRKWLSPIISFATLGSVESKSTKKYWTSELDVQRLLRPCHCSPIGILNLVHCRKIFLRFRLARHLLILLMITASSYTMHGHFSQKLVPNQI
jgi:hypothetical protein